MHQFMVSIFTSDSVGIVSQIAEAIGKLQGDIADLRQSVLHDYFTMILLVEFEAAISAEIIQSAIAAPDRHVAVQPLGHLTELERPQPEASYMLTASGPDRIGFVAAVTGFCAQHGINILDLSTTRNEGEYVMMLQLDLTQSKALVDIRYQLRRFSEQSGIRTVLQHQDIFTATNEIL